MQSKEIIWIHAAIFISLVLLSVPANGQNSTGALRGDVQDPSGARVSSATIVAQPVGSSVTREIKADDHGEFRLNELLPGTYHLVVSAPGFGEVSSEVAVV